MAATTVITLSLFSWLVLTTTSGTGLAPHDQSVTTRAMNKRHPALIVITQVFTALGFTVGLTTLTAICATLLLMRGHRVRALALSFTMISSSLLTAALKEISRRARPSIDTLPGEPASTTSFPSGHSFNMAVFAGMLAGMALTSTAVTLYRTLAIMTMAGATLLVGASRVYLGYHWMTDVLAGWSLGLAWLCLVTLALLWLKGQRHQPPSLVTMPSDRSSRVEGIEPPPTWSHQQAGRPDVGSHLGIDASWGPLGDPLFLVDRPGPGPQGHGLHLGHSPHSTLINAIHAVVDTEEAGGTVKLTVDVDAEPSPLNVGEARGNWSGQDDGG